MFTYDVCMGNQPWNEPERTEGESLVFDKQIGYIYRRGIEVKP